MEKILIADDEPLVRNFLRDALKSRPYEIRIAEDGERAIEFMKREHFDLIFTDVKMPRKDGLEVLRYAKKEHPSTPVIVMTAYGSIENAVDAIQLGAFHYLIKPFSIDTLDALFEKAVNHISLVKENSYLRAEISHVATQKHGKVIIQSPQMKRIWSDIEKIAKSHASVFISGESGTGKEVIAQAIHFLSHRSARPFITVNCAAISDTLIESEFFGHEKGAFTGALNRRIGRLELAHNGTLFLDEVTEIPIQLQSKLLRAIQEQEFERVGSEKAVKVDVRFLSTSNRNMKEAIEKKIFREDLYFRLNVVPIHIPPLRERKEDILPLAQHFLDTFCCENHKPKKTLTPGAEQKLLNYPWPGNVRELGNIIERTVVLDQGEKVSEEHLYLEAEPLSPPKNKSPVKVGATLHDMEKQLILETLVSLKDNKTKTAEALGISLRTLRNKLKTYAS
jgi:two-component system, NtrC family, response regulator AtoC